MNTTVDFDADGPAGRALAAYLNRLDERGIEFRQRIRQEVLAEFADAQDALLAYFADEDTIESSRETILDRHPAADERNVIRYVGDYALLEHIGTGGMGTVYRARQSTTGRIVAVKLVRNSSPEMLERFRREAQAIANLRHPNIVTLFEAGEHEGEFYYSMDYIENGSLSRAIRDARPSPKQAAEWTQMIAGALDYAHSKGVLHRDIKPQNILLDEQRNPLIADFGLAKLMQDGKAWEQSRAIVGTFAYMPPEQAQASDAHLGPASDVYSLGATLYEMLTGRPPIEGDNEAEVIQRLIAREPKPIRSSNPEVPIDLEIICLKCLSKDSAGRYRTAKLLSDDLNRYLRNEPVLARPITLFERGVRWCRREPYLAASALAVSLSLAIALVVFAIALRNSLASTIRLAESHLDSTYSSANSLSEQAALALASNQPLRSIHLLGKSLMVLEAAPPAPNTDKGNALSQRIATLTSNLKLRIGGCLQSRATVVQVIPFEDDSGPHEKPSMPLLSQQKELPIKTGIRESFLGMLFSPDKRFGVTCQGSLADGRLTIFDIEKGVKVATITVPDPKEYIPSCFSCDSKELAVYGFDNRIRRWSMATGEEILPALAHVTNDDEKNALFVTGMIYTVSGEFVFSATNQRTVHVWSRATGRQIAEMKLPDATMDVACNASAQVTPPTGHPMSFETNEVVTFDTHRLTVSHHGETAAVLADGDCYLISFDGVSTCRALAFERAIHTCLVTADGSRGFLLGKAARRLFDTTKREFICDWYASDKAKKH